MKASHGQRDICPDVLKEAVMLEERSTLNSEENFSLRIGGRPAKKADKKESSVEGEIVRFKLDVACSVDLAERFLKECVWVLKESKRNRFFEAKARPFPTNPLIPPSNEWPAPGKTCVPSEPDNGMWLPKWTGSVLSALFLLVMISLSSPVGHTYLQYNKKQASERARQKATKAQSQLYEAFVAQNLEALLAKLDQLTAIERMRRAFPEITSLPAIARFKRGPDLTKKASATVELLWRVKDLFNAWTHNPHQFPPPLRPTKKEIALFLKFWTETEALLEELARAKQEPGTLFSAANR